MNNDLATIEQLSALITSRRTNLRIDPEKSVSTAIVEQLCSLATWAPNHKRTSPWRFCAITGESRAVLGQLAAADVERRGGDASRVEKSKGKYLRAPVVLAIACASEVGSSESRAREDRDAVSAGIQNILLGATALGLASYWGTGDVTSAEGVHELCGFPNDAVILAFVYLGWPIGDVPNPGRDAPIISYAY